MSLSEIWLNPFASKSYLLSSPLTIEESCERLRRATVTPTWESVSNARPEQTPVMGEVGSGGFRITKLTTGIRSFGLWATGNFASAPGGVRVKVVIARSPFLSAFQAIFTGFLLFVTFLVVASAIARGDLHALLGTWPLLIVVGVMLSTVWLSHRQTRGDEPFLLAFLENALEAHV